MKYAKLIEESRAARLKAHAPYSKFLVGAALLTKDGKIIHGCNVENASYGLCNCAERTALFAAVASGYKKGDFEAIAVTGNTDDPIAPCGACRQVMVELGGSALGVVMANTHGQRRTSTAGDLLPGAFDFEPPIA